MTDLPDRGRYLAAARDLLDRLDEQFDAIDRVSRISAEAIGSGHLVHLFGSGHSRIPVEEMFPRYGSFPGFHPIVELSLTYHTQVVGANGQRQAMFIERVEGLAERILANFALDPSDVMIVFSASGLTAVPVEMAQLARAEGLTVVAVTSVQQSVAGTPTHSSGARLVDHADIVLDLGTPPGDAMVHIDGLVTPVGPGSSLAAVALVNEIKVRTAQLLVDQGALPPVLDEPDDRRRRRIRAALRRRLCRARRAGRPALPTPPLIRSKRPREGRECLLQALPTGIELARGIGREPREHEVPVVERDRDPAAGAVGNPVNASVAGRRSVREQPAQPAKVAPVKHEELEIAEPPRRMRARPK